MSKRQPVVRISLPVSVSSLILFLLWVQKNYKCLKSIYIYPRFSALIQFDIIARTSITSSSLLYRTSDCRFVLLFYLSKAHFKRFVISRGEYYPERILFWIFHRLMWAWNLRRTCILKIYLSHRFNIYDMGLQESLLFPPAYLLGFPSLYSLLFT